MIDCIKYLVAAYEKFTIKAGSHIQTRFVLINTNAVNTEIIESRLQIMFLYARGVLNFLFKGYSQTQVNLTFPIESNPSHMDLPGRDVSAEF